MPSHSSFSTISIIFFLSIHSVSLCTILIWSILPSILFVPLNPYVPSIPSTATDVFVQLSVASTHSICHPFKLLYLFHPFLWPEALPAIFLLRCLSHVWVMSELNLICLSQIWVKRRPKKRVFTTYPTSRQKYVDVLSQISFVWVKSEQKRRQVHKKGTFLNQIDIFGNWLRLSAKSLLPETEKIRYLSKLR